jgi:hypothetical protein
LNGRAEQLLAFEFNGEAENNQSSSSPDAPSSPRGEMRTFEMPGLESGQVTATKPADATKTAPSTAKGTGQSTTKSSHTLDLEKPPVERLGNRTGQLVRKNLGQTTDPSLMRGTTVSHPSLSNGTRPVTPGTHSTRRPMPAKRGVNFVALGSVLGVVVAGALLFSQPGKNLLSRFGIQGLDGDRSPGSVKTPAPVAAESKPKVDSRTISLKINLVPNADEARVLLNEKAVDPRTLTVHVLPDSPLELVVEKRGFRPFRREFVVTSAQLGELKEWVVDIGLEPISYGYLNLKSEPISDVGLYPYDPSTRTVANENKPWTVLKSPVREQKLPVGTYKVRMENKILGMEKVITVKIEEGRVANISEDLDILK